MQCIKLKLSINMAIWSVMLNNIEASHDLNIKDCKYEVDNIITVEITS